jgi:hypothetical protein
MRTVGTRPRIWTVKEGELEIEREETSESRRTEVLGQLTVRERGASGDVGGGGRDGGN